MPRAKTVDQYIAQAPAKARAMLKSIRAIVRREAPQAQEKISYGMPYYAYHGRLLYVAAHTNHCGLYAMPDIIRAFKKELKAYKTSTGAVQFPYGGKLPLSLIRRMVRARVRENEVRAKKK